MGCGSDARLVGLGQRESQQKLIGCAAITRGRWTRLQPIAWRASIRAVWMFVPQKLTATVVK
jgi:hypothetical protein